MFAKIGALRSRIGPQRSENSSTRSENSRPQSENRCRVGSVSGGGAFPAAGRRPEEARRDKFKLVVYICIINVLRVLIKGWEFAKASFRYEMYS